MTPVIETHDVQKSFGAVVAAKDISLQIPSGARLSLIGSNGAGKTTFVNMVTGYIKPDRGRIVFAGTDITGMQPRQITNLGISRSFQIPQTFLDLTALENVIVAFSVSTRGGLSSWRSALSASNIERAREILEHFALSEYADRPVSELAGGVRKLLDIAMALTGHPKVLLLDEPTSGVSVDEKFPVMDTIMNALSHENVTVMFVEHDMDIVLRYADRVLAFYSGEIIADDLPDEVLSDQAVKKYVTGETA